MSECIARIDALGAVWGEWVRRGERKLGTGRRPGSLADREALRFDSALRHMRPADVNLLYCRFVLELNYVRLIGYGFNSEWQARLAVEGAMLCADQALEREGDYDG